MFADNNACSQANYYLLLRYNCVAYIDSLSKTFSFVGWVNRRYGSRNRTYFNFDDESRKASFHSTQLFVLKSGIITSSTGYYILKQHILCLHMVTYVMCTILPFFHFADHILFYLVQCFFLHVSFFTTGWYDITRYYRLNFL